MNNEMYFSNIKSLKTNYIIHLILQGIILIYNYIFLKEIYWLHKLIYCIYISISSFITIYFFIPIIPFIFILFKKFSRKLIRRFKLLSLIFCVLVLITGLSITIILMINALESTDFCHECPFNLENSYINKIYSEYSSKNINEKNLEEECKNRRCIFNNKISDIQYLYEYICNYDPQGEFEEIKNVSNSNETIEQIKCSKIDNDNNNYYFEEININYFYEMCKTYNEYFICQRATLPKNYSLKDNYKCPKTNYLKNLAFFCMISVFLNLIIAFIPWKLEYNKYKNIMQDLILRGNRQGSKSLNSTQNVSKIQKNEESFKKEPTQTIIIYNENEENIASEDKVNEKDTNEEYYMATEDNLNQMETKDEKNKNKNKKTINLIDNEYKSPKINIENKNINIKSNDIRKKDIKNNDIKNNDIKNNDTKNNEIKNNDIKISKIRFKRPTISSKNLYNNNQKLNNKSIHEKLNNNDKMKKEENNSIKIFRINDSPHVSKKKENKKIKEIKEIKEIKVKEKDKDKDEDKFVRSNSYKISYYSDRNILEESKSVPDM